jgi:hypothetical protein
MILFPIMSLYLCGMIAAMMIDLFENEPTRRAIRAEFEEQTRGRKYHAMIPDGPPPFYKAGQP